MTSAAAIQNCERLMRRHSKSRRHWAYVVGLPARSLPMKSTSYDSNNIFAKILRGEVPCHKVYEDDKVLAFLDVRPRAPKHTVVIAKAPARNILDVDSDELAHLVNAVWLIARCLPADGLTIEQHNESAGDQEVFHLHFHLMPRQEGVPLKAPRGEIEKPETLTKQAEHIELRSLRCSSCAAEVGPHKLGCFDLGGLPPGRILLYDFSWFRGMEVGARACWSRRGCARFCWADLPGLG
jgi:histidine triad (HIT) family protein